MFLIVLEVDQGSDLGCDMYVYPREDLQCSVWQLTLICQADFDLGPGLIIDFVHILTVQ